ncbi:hypothetical protein [Ferruginibacter profundus]
MRKISAFFILCLLTACSSSIDSPAELISKFNTHRKEFDQLLSDLNTNPVVDSLYRGTVTRRSEELPKDIYRRLLNLNIPIVYRHYCCNKKPCQAIFVFQTTWNTKVPFIIDNNPCDSLRTKINSYVKDKNNNEFWGLGDSWQIYKEVKAFEIDQ